MTAIRRDTILHSFLLRPHILNDQFQQSSMVLLSRCKQIATPLDAVLIIGAASFLSEWQCFELGT